MLKPACDICGYVHASNDVRAVGLFSGSPSYVAHNAGTPPRTTRTEAEVDVCRWRQARRSTTPSDSITKQDAPTLFSLPIAPNSTPVTPFPAAAMEAAARAKAWCDFLAQVRLSLLVWQIDGEVREGCEHVLAWLQRCLGDLEGVRP